MSSALGRHPGRMRHRGLASFVVAGLLLLVAGCGGTSSSAQGPAALAILDASSSFRQFAPDCASDFLTVARAVAVRGGHMYAGALLTGDPYSQRFTVDVDFGGKPPASIEGNDQLEAAYRRRQADRLSAEFEQMSQERAAVSGSPVLGTLARASELRRERAADRPFWLVVCSDLANISDAVDVRKPIDGATVARTIKRWAPELEGLRGAELYFIGAGRLRPGSAIRPQSIKQVEQIVRGVAARVGARVELVDTQLGDSFPLHDG